jgi:hypothetical protein
MQGWPAGPEIGVNAARLAWRPGACAESMPWRPRRVASDRMPTQPRRREIDKTSGVFGTSDKYGSVKLEPMRESDPALGRFQRVGCGGSEL